MTAASVSIVGTRVNPAENTTGVSSIGGGSGASAEPSFAYQDTNLINRKVTSSSGAGFGITSGNEDFTGIPKAFIRKVAITDFAGLNTAFGDRARIGNSTTVYATFVCAGTNTSVAAWETFKPRNGITIKAIDPSIDGYRESVNGSPGWNAVDYYGTVAAFANSTAKSENVGCDAIDVMQGLILLNGGGANPKATYQDVFDFDEGTRNNRYGMFFEFAPDTFGQHGTLQKGSLATPVDFNDSQSTIFYPDSMTATGYTRLRDNLENAASVIIDGATHRGLGNTNITDTRPIADLVGSAGSATYSRSISNFTSISYNAAVTVAGESIDNCGTVTQNGATIVDLTVTNSVNTYSVKLDSLGIVSKLFTDGLIDLSDIVSTTMTLTNITCAGGIVNSASDVIINQGDGSNIGTTTDWTNIGSGNVTVIAGLTSFTFALNPLIVGYEWRMYTVANKGSLSGAVEIPGTGEENATSSAQTYSYTWTSDEILAVQILDEPNFIESVTYYDLSNQNQAVTINLISEDNQ